MSKESNKSGGIGLAGAIFIVFLVLKLIGKIDWSWWWVTAPLWIPLAICLAVCVIMLIIVALQYIFSGKY